MFGKTPAPVGFGQPAPPATGGFGAATGGFGKAPPPAAGGFGAAPPAAGGFGAAPPAAGGFGAAPPAAGGFGAAPPAAGGFGAAPPAAGGFGAAPPAAGGFGVAPPTAGGFGKAPAAGGFGAAPGGFGSSAGGFGAAPPAAGGFGKAPAAPGAQPQLVYTGIQGPGYTAPNTPSWVTGTDLSQITDDTLVSKLPQNLQQHLGQLLEFGAQERNARSEIQQMHQNLQSEGNKKGLRALQERLDNLNGASTQGVDQLIVSAYHRDKAAKQLLLHVKETEDDISSYSRDVWDRIHREGVEYWQQKLNQREGPSELLRNMLENTAQVMAEVDDVLTTLAAALAPLQRHSNVRATANGKRVGSSPLPPPPTSRILQSNHSGRGGASSPSPAVGTTAVSGPYVGGTGHHPFDLAVAPITAPTDPIQLVQESLHQTMAAFLNLGDTVSDLHSRTNQVRDHVVRYYGEAEAEDLFAKDKKNGTGEDDFAGDHEADEFVTVTIGDTMKGRLRSAGDARVSKAIGAARSLIPGVSMPRHAMRYDPQLDQGNGNVAPAPTTAATGGFGAQSATAPSAGGFGVTGTAASSAPSTGFGAPQGAAKQPAAPGGFGAPPPAANGFGAPPPAASGFGAPPSTAPGKAASAVGFGGSASPGGAAMSNQQGVGATPAPTGFGAAATPGSGATPSVISQSFGGLSPSPTGPVNFGGSPSPVPNASPDDRPKNRRRT